MSQSSTFCVIMQEVANQAGAAISRLTGFADGGFREALVLETPLVSALVAYLDGSASHVQYHAAAALIALAGADSGACRKQVGLDAAQVERLAQVLTLRSANRMSAEHV